MSDAPSGECLISPGFARLGSQCAAGLAGIVGDEHVHTDPDHLAWAGWDALDVYRSYGRPQAAPVLAVVRPGTAEEVAEVLRWAAQERIAVVPRGAGTGVMGGAIPLRPAIVLDLTRLRDVIVHCDDMCIEAGAGATLACVAREAEKRGLMFAHDPWSLSLATVGGAIGTNGMGYLFGPYGKMGDQVLGVEVALPGGSLVRTRPTLSGGPGPMLHKLFAGAEGAMGVVTRVWLRAWPAPESRLFSSYRFPTFAAGFAAVTDLFRRGIVPTMMDMTDTPEEPGSGAPVAGSSSSQSDREVTVLHLGFFSFREAAEAASARAARELAGHGAESLGSGPAQAYWERRHDVAERYRREVQEPRDHKARLRRLWGLEFLNVELPISKVLAYRQACFETLERYPQLKAGETGLWGRPEVFSIVIHDVSDGEEGAQAMAEVTDRLLCLAQEMGGTMEAIHGPGSKLLHLLRREWDAGYELIRAIKAAIDPQGVLNPGRWQ